MYEECAECGHRSRRVGRETCQIFKDWRDRPVRDGKCRAYRTPQEARELFASRRPAAGDDEEED